MKFFSPLGFLALLGIPVVVLMYLLKQKYQEKEVSSLFLWQKAVALSQSSEPWQKLKKNWLLFLQILGIILFALALANPYGMFGKTPTHYVLGLDCSMSMQATDVSPSRFEKAKGELLAMLQDAPPQTKFTLVILGEHPQIAIANSSNKAEVKKQVTQQAVENGGVDWEKALPLLDMAQKQNTGQVVLFTDQPYDTQGLPTQQKYFGENTENCGVTLFSHVSGEEGMDVFAKVKNFGTTNQEKTVTLFADNEVLDVVDVSLKAGAQQDVLFTQIPLQNKKMWVKMTPEDDLKADDIAYDTLAQERKHKVLLVSEGNVFLEKALLLFPNVEFYKTNSKNLEILKGYSLYLFDGVVPEELPKDGHCMFFNPPTGNPIVTMKKSSQKGFHVKGTGMQEFSFMDGLEFDLFEGNTLQTPEWAWNTLKSGENTFGIAGEKDGKKIAVFSFDLKQSDLPLKKEFPIFMYEFLQWYFPASNQKLENNIAGQEFSIPLEPETKKAYIKTPLGEEITVAPPFPPEVFTHTNQTGFYTLFQTNQEEVTTETTFVVNPKTEGESDLQGRVEDTKEVSIEKNKTQVGGSLKNIFLFLFLGLLLIEWRVNCREY